ncbi:phage replication protein O [Pseudomonas sp. URIL14HWK12:I9]|nr:phage replication protein O [Pseudomonas sp. URIL14HWK12:I12]PVZ27013.1 phage replication protein O [Pseudomonas sp. URIL14HWK12:I10]PVZ37902.1 phage replication protein O [Pseudomonas sp. URIL14HWK12:I11]SNZ05210.1 phage replication protein O [Pseudomonas sp. URIL14HWK12:I9]
MDGLMAIELSAREMKIVLYVAKATLNFGAGAQRIPATDIAKATHIHPDTVSKAISGLLRRRVLFREGGARGDIGLCDPKEWVFVVEPKQTKPSDPAEVVRIGSAAKQTKTADCLLYSKKETQVTLPSEEITSPLAEDEPAKPQRKAPFGLKQLQADNPHGLTDTLLKDWLALRKEKRAAVTATVWASLNAELVKCQEQGIAPDVALTEALSAGWQGFKVAWIAKRLAEQAQAAPSTANSRHHGFADRSYTAGLTPKGDGTYAF